MKPQVSIIMGSDSDLPVMEEAAKILDEFGISYEILVVSAHRTPKKMILFGSKAQSRGVKVIIAGAGGAAHLPGMVASVTQLPVIGVPVQLKTLDGMDSLLSIAQMPKGVPVATMAINNAFNAGLLAIRILAIQSKPLQTKLSKFQSQQKEKVNKANRTISKQYRTKGR